MHGSRGIKRLSILICKRWKILKLLAIMELFLVNTKTQYHLEAVNKRKKRRCRRFLRNTGWWETVWENYDNHRFKNEFRVSKEIFKFILNKIGYRLEKEDVADDPISPAMRLGICLYKLSRGDYDHTIADVPTSKTLISGGLLKYPRFRREK